MTKRVVRSRLDFTVEPLNWVSPERRKELDRQARETEAEIEKAAEKRKN